MPPPYTFEAARELLLGRQSPALKALDRLLGVALLAAGPAGALTGSTSMLLAWGWIDQKNELIARLGDAFDAGRSRLAAARGAERHEVLAATHTVLVVASYFEALHAVLGARYEALEVTDEEKHRLATDTVSFLFRSPILLPWAGRGFARNVEQQTEPFYHRLTRRCFTFFEGLAAWREPEPGLRDRVVAAAVDRYRAQYAILAGEVPEFAIWTMLGEHAASQSALARLEELVSRLGNAPHAEVMRTMAALNRSVLDEEVADLGNLTAARSPLVRDGYVEPGFRYAFVDQAARPAEDAWWSRQPAGDDLSTFLAACFASPDAARRPLVVLGQPGAGKSLLTRVCAARLSATDAFTVVRVPLRDVPDPAAPIFQQVDAVLLAASNGRVRWADLSAAGRGRTHVVFFDGLDELMQATGATESDYLSRVKDFQDVEARTGGAVAAVVTSRTVVADLAEIPPGCLMIKLEEFSDDRVRAWVTRWNEANAGRPADAEALLRYGDLIRQPLLLLLVVVVAAAYELPASADSAKLYRTLLDHFVDRELDKPDTAATETRRDLRRQTEYWRLGLIAFGMANRGRQYLHEQDLLEDLRALPGPPTPGHRHSRDVNRVLDPARRMVGRFFFVHTAEAAGGAAGRSYEFLHATFADYLIAHHVLDQLRGLRNVCPSSGWDDQLFALISHRVLGASGGRSLDLFAELAIDEPELGLVIDQLVARAEDRWERGRFGAYDPSRATYFRRMAAYTANLVLLRTAMGGGPVAIAGLCPTDQPSRWWADLVEWWRVALYVSEARELTRRMHLSEGREKSLTAGPVLSGALSDQLLLLAGNDREAWTQASATGLYVDATGMGDPGGLEIASRLTAWLARGGTDRSELRSMLERIDWSSSPEARRLALICVERCAALLPYPLVLRITSTGVQSLYRPMAELLASIVAQVPRLLVGLPTIPGVIAVEPLDEARRLRVSALLTLGAAVTDAGASLIEEELSEFLLDADLVATERTVMAGLPPGQARMLIPAFARQVSSRRAEP